MSFPYLKTINLTEMKDATIARLIVGTRHCLVLTVGNINCDATGFEIGQKYRSQFKQV